jgi:thiol-disulfide isomerase/thioredoxin
VRLRRRPAAQLSRALAPEFDGVTRWLNVSSPVSLRGLRGNVVLLEFWTFGCINCVRTLPFMIHVDARYRTEGLAVVGIHTPEFHHEASAGAVRAAVASHRLHYAVGLDNSYATWKAYGVKAWPTLFVVDRRGAIAHRHVGEGGYTQTERAVNRLLAEPAPSAPDAAANRWPAPRAA